MLLTKISCFRLQVKSLNLSNHGRIPIKGLRVFSHQITTLTSLICSKLVCIRQSDLFLIADCFPFLEELDLSLPRHAWFDDDFGINSITLALPKLRKVNLSGSYINNSSLFYLCKNCEFLEEVVMFKCKRLTHVGIASAIRERPHLRSFYTNLPTTLDTGMELIDSLRSLKCLRVLDLSLSYISDQLLSSLADEGLTLRRLVLRRCTGYSYTGLLYLLSKSHFLQHLDLQNLMFLNDQCVAELSKHLLSLVSIDLSYCTEVTTSTLFALVENCPFLNEIRMEYTFIGLFAVEKRSSFRDSVVNPRMEMKSLHLANNLWLKDETIKLFASICPNLQLLDLSHCSCISDEGIVEVLSCCKIMHLNLSSCPKVNLYGMNFQVPKLEALNLSFTRIDDKTLYAISKSCSGLLQLDLEKCYKITEKGVKQVVKNCTRLKEINLRNCCKVSVGVGLWMGIVLSSSSLRKIMTPPHFFPNHRKWKPLLNHGCFLC
jgi:F-box/leucine-rich repeat protein 2/20